MLLGLTGVAHSGKSTIADYLKDEYGFKQYYFAGPVKQALYNMNPLIKRTISSGYYGQTAHLPLQEIVDDLGWDEAKKIPMVRELLQRMGTEAGRDIHGEDVWVNHTFADIHKECEWEHSFHVGEGVLKLLLVTDVVIPDLRFTNEAERIKRHGGLIIRVDRGYDPVNNHISEAGLDLNLVDINFYNNGNISELGQEIDKLLEYTGYENIRRSRNRT